MKRCIIKDYVSYYPIHELGSELGLVAYANAADVYDTIVIKDGDKYVTLIGLHPKFNKYK